MERLARNGDIFAFGGDDGEVGERDDGLQVGHVLGLHVLPNVGADDQHPSFGVVDEGFDVLAGKLVQHRYDDSAVGGDGEVGDGPFGAVVAAERDLVALPYAHLLEIVAKTRHLLSHLLEGVVIGAVVVR